MTDGFGYFDLRRGEPELIEVPGASLEHVLPQDPTAVILSLPAARHGDAVGAVRDDFRARDYVELDLGSGRKRPLFEGDVPTGRVLFDARGLALITRGFDPGTDEYTWYRRSDDGDSWVTFFREHKDSADRFTVHGMDPQLENMLVVSARNGDDKTGIWEFDMLAGRFGELVYRRNDVDVAAVRYHSNTWTDWGRIAGIAYFKDGHQFEYFDATEAALYTQLAERVPDPGWIGVASRSRDGETLALLNVADRDPGTFYLIRKARLVRIGSRSPGLSARGLADVGYVTYDARDGTRIPASVTRPAGTPPFPLVVMPTSEPFAHNAVVFDRWAQLLANAGYLVLRPSHRGTRGLGARFHQLALKGGSQAGYRMQDDMDDGVAYLVGRGMADRKHVAMFGWSYGGYAALVAASRNPDIYQCVIAGSAIVDTALQAAWLRGNTHGRQRNELLALWADGVNPMDEAGDIRTPVLLLHGDDDQRVPAFDVNRYLSQLDAHDKDYRYVELDGAGHGRQSMSTDARLVAFDAVLEFLRDDCSREGG